MLEQSYYDCVDNIIDRYGSRPEKLIPIIQDIQSEYRYLPPELLSYVADKIGITEAKAFSVATFYENFSFDPKGKYVIKVCDGTACHVRGSSGILERLYSELGLSKKKSTTDGRDGILFGSMRAGTGINGKRCGASVNDTGSSIKIDQKITGGGIE